MQILRGWLKVFVVAYMLTGCASKPTDVTVANTVTSEVHEIAETFWLSYQFDLHSQILLKQMLLDNISKQMTLVMEETVLGQRPPTEFETMVILSEKSQTCLERPDIYEMFSAMQYDWFKQKLKSESQLVKQVYELLRTLKMVYFVDSIRSEFDLENNKISIVGAYAAQLMELKYILNEQEVFLWKEGLILSNAARRDALDENEEQFTVDFANMLLNQFEPENSDASCTYLKQWMQKLWDNH